MEGTTGSDSTEAVEREGENDKENRSKEDEMQFGRFGEGSLKLGDGVWKVNFGKIRVADG